MATPTPIGKNVHTKFKKEVELDEVADKFSVLQFLVQPPCHEVTAEVALFNDAGECVGPARWVQINPDDAGKDNWTALQKKTLANITAMVKDALAKWTDEVAIGT